MIQDIPRSIYHYTSINTLDSILESGTWRLYDINKQNDPFEIYYAGNKLFNYYFNLLNSPSMLNTKDNNNKVIQYCIVALYKYFTNENAGQDRRILELTFKQANKTALVNQFLQVLNGRELKFFISCFSDNPFNSNLWQEYANNYEGVVVEFEVDRLSEFIGEGIGFKKV